MRYFSDLFRNVFQIAYVTEDIDAAVAYFQSTLGTVKCDTHYGSNLGGMVVVDGETVDEWVIDVALVNAGHTNLEIIRPVSGAVDLYRQGIRPGAPATFHHLGFLADFGEATEAVAACGKQWKQYGQIADSIKFGYVDMTAELGHFVEIMDMEQSSIDRFAELEAVVEPAALAIERP